MSHFDITQAQPRAWSMLARAWKAGRPHTGYLLTGEEGLGHWPLAVAYAALVNCEAPRTGEADLPQPCGQCPACRGVFALNHEALIPVVPVKSHKNESEFISLTTEVLDAMREQPFRILTPSANVTISIDAVRRIKALVSRIPPPGLTRVVLFHQVDRMLLSSADALLKLLEEPPARTILILTTAQPRALLPTILSRCLRVNLQRVSVSLLAGYLREATGCSEQRAELVARLAEGNPGRALALLAEEEDGEAAVRAVAVQLFRALFTQSSGEVLSLLVELVNDRNRSEAERILAIWQSLLRDLLWLAGTGNPDGMTNVDVHGVLTELTAHVPPPEALDRMKDAIKNALADLRRNAHIHLCLAALAIRLQSYLRAAA